MFLCLFSHGRIVFFSLFLKKFVDDWERPFFPFFPFFLSLEIIVWRYLSNFRKNKETLTNGRGRAKKKKKKKKRGCNFFELWNKKKSAWRASELAGILIGMPALTYLLPLEEFSSSYNGKMIVLQKVFFFQGAVLMCQTLQSVTDV